MNWERPKVYAVKHKDEATRAASRSGGIFTALSDLVLSNGGVVYGCVLTDDFDAVHIRTDNAEERNRMRGSKYIQSKLGDTFRNVYAFSNAVAYLKRNSYIEPTGVKGSYRVIKKKSKSVDESTEEFKTLNKELELKEMREKVKKCVRETYLELEKILDEEKPSVYGRNKHTYEDVTTLIEYMRKFDFIVEE